MARVDTPIQEISAPCEAASGRRETLPGVARPTAEMIVAAMGTAMRRVPRADHVASWAGVAPGHHARAGKRLSGTTRQGQRCLRTVWVQAAHAAARPSRTDRRAQYRRLATRRGKQRAMRAVAPSMLVMADSRIQRQEPSREAGGDFVDRLPPEDTARRLVKRLEHLGYHVALQHHSTDSTPSQRVFSRQCQCWCRAKFLGGPMRLHRLAQHSLLVVFGLTLAWGMCEVALRVAYRTPWHMQLLQAQTGNQLLQYRRNQLGLRDRDYPTIKPPATRRVLVLGDSFTFGSGVPDDFAVFPKVLEELLNKPTGSEKTPHIDVLNGGLPGSLTGDWVQLLERVNDSFHPDVVLVVFFLRDGTRTSSMGSFFGPVRNRITRRNSTSRRYRYSFVYRLVRDSVDRRRIAEQYTATLNRSYFGTSEQTVEWRLAQKNILQLARFAREHAAVMGLAIFPILVDLHDQYPFGAICDTMNAFAVSNSIPVHNLLPDFKGHDAPGLWVSVFDQHPNERGHAIAARALLPFVRDLLANHEQGLP